MPDRHFPVRPDLGQLEQQAEDLLRSIRGDTPAAKLADAQHKLARSYGIASWPRLELACRLIDAIWIRCRQKGRSGIALDRRRAARSEVERSRTRSLDAVGCYGVGE